MKLHSYTSTSYALMPSVQKYIPEHTTPFIEQYAALDFNLLGSQICCRDESACNFIVDGNEPSMGKIVKFTRNNLNSISFAFDSFGELVITKWSHNRRDLKFFWHLVSHIWVITSGMRYWRQQKSSLTTLLLMILVARVVWTWLTQRIVSVLLIAIFMYIWMLMKVDLTQKTTGVMISLVKVAWRKVVQMAAYQWSRCHFSMIFMTLQQRLSEWHEVSRQVFYFH